VQKPADRVLWYHTVLDWIDQWVKPDRAEYQRQLNAAAAPSSKGPLRTSIDMTPFLACNELGDESEASCGRWE
jgi:hypothetical protein